MSKIVRGKPGWFSARLESLPWGAAAGPTPEGVHSTPHGARPAAGKQTGPVRPRGQVDWCVICYAARAGITSSAAITDGLAAR
jgi:hypothetical protein